MKTLKDLLIERLRNTRECPCCGELVSDVDEGPEPDWRNADDVFAVRFCCAGEISVTDDDYMVSLSPCHSILQDEANQIHEAATEELEEQEDEE